VLGQSEKSLRIFGSDDGLWDCSGDRASKGHRVIGVDIDPLAVLITTVWSTAVDADHVKQKALEVLERARIIFRICLTLRPIHGMPIQNKSVRKVLV